MSEAAIIAAGLSAGYGTLEILHDISLQCRAGEIVLVVGHNGAGKTTLLNCLAGLLQPSAGSLTVGDMQPTIGEVAYLTQKQNVFREKTVFQNLAVGLTGRFSGLSRIQRDEIFSFVKADFPDLLERMDERAGTLSGGQQQMTALARTLLAPRPFCLLDEPTLGLSERQIDRVLPVLRESATRRGRGIVVVEHRVSLMIPFSDKVLVLKRGRVTLERTTSGISELKDISNYYF